MTATSATPRPRARLGAALLALLAGLSAAQAQVAVPELSTGFEGDAAASGWFVGAFEGGAATSDLASAAAARSGASGCRITTSTGPLPEQTIKLLSPGYPLVAGRSYVVTAWIRSSAAFVPSLQIIRFQSDLFAGYRVDLPLSPAAGYTRFVAAAFVPDVTSTYRLAFEFGAAPAGTVIDVDDVSVTVDAATPGLEVVAGFSTGFEPGQAQPYALSVLAPASATATFVQPGAQAGGSAAGAVVSVAASGVNDYDVQLLSGVVALDPGATYTMSAWLRADRPVTVTTSFNGGPPSFPFLPGSTSPPAALSTGYAFFQLSTFVAPAGGGSWRAQFNFGGLGGGPVTLFLDDVVVVKTGGTSSGGGGGGGNGTTTVIISEGFEGPGAPVVTSQVISPGAATVDLASPAAAAAGSARGARITKTSPPGTNWFVQLLSAPFAVTAGATYTLSADLRTSAAGGAPASLVFLDAGAGYSVLGSADVTLGAAFATFTARLTAASSAASVIVTANFNGGPAGTYDIDNVRVVATTGGGGGGSTTLPGATTSFEAGTPVPFVGQVLAPAAGAIALDSAASPATGARSAAVSIATPAPGAAWRVQLQSAPLSLAAGSTYRFSVALRATAAATPVSVSLNSGAPAYATLAGSPNTFTVGTAYATYSFAVTPAASGTWTWNTDFGAAAAGTTVFADDFSATAVA